MIYPGNQSPSSSGGLTTKARGGSTPRAAGGCGGGGGTKSGRPTTDPRKPVKAKQQAVVQWKQRNVKEGIVVVDETQLSKLIKREPIDKFYQLDPEPFATGLFASVRRCVSRDTGQQFAAKFASRVRYGEDCSAEIHHEIALLSLCAPSPRVVRLHDVFETAAEIIIVLQFAPGGDLQTIIDDNLVPFESDVVNFVRQLCEGLVYLHDRKIAHLDIKPQNLVMMADFPDCDVKLCDFEISRVILEGTEIREILGTPDYVAPEILHYEPITLAADLWSLGVTTYVLLTGFSPFGGETDQETFCNISRAQLDFPEELFEDVSPEAQEFIKQLLVRDPRARPTAKQCLRHRWFTNQTSPNKTQPASPHDNKKLTTTTPPNNADKTRTTPPSSQNQNLRKYLSKSREALFERAVQQSNANTSLRKTTLLSQCNRTRRLCESQFSLVSKSREGSLNLSPSFSRSREKLYGLRSLSKSHEMLDLCAAVVAGSSPHQEILKTLTRATTADLSLLLRQTQLPSMEQIHADGKTNDSTLPNQEEAVDTNNCLNNNNNKPKPVVIDMITQPAPLLSPMLIRNNSENKFNNYPSKLNPEQVQLIDNNNSMNNIHLTEKQSIPSTPTTKCCPDLTYEPEDDKEITIKNDEPTVEQITGQTNEETEECKQLTEESETTVVPLEASGVGDENCMEEEPRYSVAQLVSAFNRHQEVITKTSLEVTMVAGDKDTKILPVIVEASNSKFPTGPNALRLFIPDIDIAMKYPPVRKRVKQANNKNRTQADRSAEDGAIQKELTQIRETDEEPSPTEEVGNTNASIICRLIIESHKGVTCPEEKDTRKSTEASSNYLRSGSLSSDTSDSRTPSDAPSSMEMSWEEFHPGTAKTTDPTAVSAGSYVRAAGKFGGEANPPAENNRPNRKSLTVIGSPQETKVNEKQRRKSFY